jgi:hypothetical protein
MTPELLEKYLQNMCALGSITVRISASESLENNKVYSQGL